MIIEVKPKRWKALISKTSTPRRWGPYDLIGERFHVITSITQFVQTLVSYIGPRKS